MGIEPASSTERPETLQLHHCCQDTFFHDYIDLMKITILTTRTYLPLRQPIMNS